MKYVEYGDIVDYNEENSIFHIAKNISNIFNKKDKKKNNQRKKLL